MLNYLFGFLRSSVNKSHPILRRMSRCDGGARFFLTSSANHLRALSFGDLSDMAQIHSPECKKPALAGILVSSVGRILSSVERTARILMPVTFTA